MFLSIEKLSSLDDKENKKGDNGDWFGHHMLEKGDWENKIIPALRKHNYPEIKKLHQKYLENYPQEQEAIEAFFNALSALSAEKQLKGHYLKGNERRKKIKELTEYQYLLTHFIAHNNKRKKELDEFWALLEEMASASQKSFELKTMRQGVLGQVAIFLSLNKLGFHPRLAHPNLDMMEKIDLQIPESSSQEEIDIQIKSSRRLISPEIFSSQNIYPSSVEIQGQKNNIIDFASQHFAEENKEFQIKIEEYKKKKKEDVKAYLVAIPYQDIDHSTGTPSPQLVSFLKEHLQEK